MNTRLHTRATAAVITVLLVATVQISSATAAGLHGPMSLLKPRISTQAKYCAGVGKAARSLCQIEIRVHASHSASFVACLGCGAGSWGRWSRSGTGWVAKGTQPVPVRASFLVVATKPGEVGRYLVYRPSPGSAGVRLSRQGCIGADIPAQTIDTSFDHLLSKLPTVPCTAPGKHVTASVFTAGLSELSTTTISHALIYGQVSKPMWLTLAQTKNSTCRPDPQAYSAAQRHSRIWYVWHLKRGRFNEGLRIKGMLASGRYCIYMQSGALYRHFPDGWTVRWGWTPYDTGDALTGPAATALPGPGTTSITLTGNAPRTETLQSFDSLTPCPEYSFLPQYLGFGGPTMQVSGAFTDTLSTANFTQSGYICSYLSDGLSTVAMSTDQVTVAGTQFKDQNSYTETADQAAMPVSNPIGGSGNTGAAIVAGQAVSVRCVLNGFGLYPFDPVWYELASPPWSDAYYAPAYDFYNNGQTSGPLNNGKRWDRAVPFCVSA